MLGAVSHGRRGAARIGAASSGRQVEEGMVRSVEAWQARLVGDWLVLVGSGR